jgi:hypothetical protein
MHEHLEPQESEQIVDRAVKEGMAGIVYQRLKKVECLCMLSEPARRRLESIYFLTLQTNLKRLSILDDILAPGVPVVLIQGAALLVQLYDDPGLRPLTDIDLWVPSEEKDHLLAVLSRLGFQTIPQTSGLLRKGDLLIDVHTHLLGVERIRSRRFLLSQSQEEILRACHRQLLGDREILCLNERDQVIFLTLHAIKHYFERLIWLADLARLVASWEDSVWEAARQRAECLGQAQLIGLLAYTLETVLDCGLTDPLIHSTEISVLDKYLLRKRRKGPLPRWSPLILLSAGGSLRQFEFVLENFFPRPAVLCEIFTPDAGLNEWRLYGKRIRQLLGMLKV